MLSPNRPKGNHARISEYPQLLRYGRLGHVRTVHKVGDGPLAVTKGL